MKIHQLKLNWEFCDAVLSGEKSFEIRFNDRGFQKGDFIEFMACCNGYKEEHNINNERFEITYVLNGYGLKEDYVVLAIKKVNKE